MGDPKYRFSGGPSCLVLHTGLYSWGIETFENLGRGIAVCQERVGGRNTNSALRVQ